MLGTVIGSEGGSLYFAMASPRFNFTGDDEWAFALPRTSIQLKKPQKEKQTNETRKGTTKLERGKQTRSKDKKKEVWESKWAILISLEVKIYACQSI